MKNGGFGKVERLRPVRPQVERENEELRAELERTRRELRQSEERFHAMADTAFEITIVHVGGTIVDVNAATLEISGYSKEDVLGKKVFEFYTPESQKMLKEKLQSPDPGPYEAELVRKDGKIIIVQVRGRDIIWNGRPARLASAQDIDEQVKAKKALRESEERFRAISEATFEGIVVHSDDRIAHVNRAVLEQTGYSRDELIGRSLLDLLEPGYREEVRDLIALPKARPVEVRLRRKNDNVLTVQIRAREIEIQGQTARVVTLMDVTGQVDARRRVEEIAAKRDEERIRLRTILDTLPVGVILADSRGAVVEANDLAAEIMGRIEDLGGRRGFRGWWADSGIELGTSDWGLIKAVENGTRVKGQMIDIERADGSRGTILESAAPLRDSHGRMTGSVAIVQDITGQRRLEREAIEAKERAELYIDLLIHDINNMNAAALGYLQLIEQREELVNRSMLRKAQGAMSEIARLVDTVRKIKTIGGTGAKHRIMDLGQIIGEVVEDHRNTPGLSATINYEPRLGRMVMASELLKEVFANIIDNAIKHSPWPVTINIWLEKRFHEGREHHVMSIEDNGPGISDELKDRLFSRLQRGNTRAKGSGLGLYLVKQLVEDFNGMVWVEDKIPGDHTKGSRFVVMLPVAYPEGVGAGMG